MSKYSQIYYVTNECMDVNYKLTPTGVVVFFQDCFAQFLTTKNLAAFDVIKDNIYWVVSEFNIDYEKDMPFWSEPVKVDVWISEIKPVKFYAEFTLSHDGEIFAKGNSCWYILDTETKRPLPMSKISDKLEVVEELTLGEHKKFRLTGTEDMVKEISHKISLSDIDFNNHVNNKSYMNIAQATISNEYKYTHTLENISIKFIKETYLDDVLTCKTYKTDEQDVCVHIIEKDGEVVCQISTKWKPKNTENIISDYKLKIRN